MPAASKPFDPQLYRPNHLTSMNSSWHEPFFSFVLPDGTVWTELDTDDRKALQTCAAALNSLLDWEEPLLRRLGESLRIAGRKRLQTNETVLLLEIW
ncbi:hypothetical protein BD309DRAFT_996573 [Dichomitus squalens]|uniref:uncharacterized protein n=1 Tax=Dichomitus squalens (strain LYAD-421) TaxID=732165 RepID=UPI0004414173|nr:uncharacterized protein DICSQDRAFT_133327 [Dichomitus squalens LYAD-421 SS1]EJF64574.1 hypothetical protein DICSQDRAFT_133327 [Dichomitus squalens LYAD-421 SS1]TBU49759.1 hypothetical protein BD309DRAFT_996573 [Dichomitus squalens]